MTQATHQHHHPPTTGDSSPQMHPAQSDGDASSISGESYWSEDEENRPKTNRERYMALKNFYKEHQDVMDFCGYFCFTLLFSLAVNANSHGEEFQRHNMAVKAAVAEQEWTSDLSPNMRKDLFDVDSIKDIWAWTTGPFLSSVLAGSTKSWPNTQPGQFYGSFRLLGLIRMRQVRVKEDSCKIPEILRGRVGRCFAPLSPNNITGASNEDTRDYGPIGINGSSRRAFQWSSDTDLKESAFYGRSWQRYPGSGYVLTIPRDYAEAVKHLEFYKENNWIDIATRVVFIDLLLYNPNLKILSQVKISIEVPPTSRMTPFATIRSAPVHMLLMSEAWNLTLFVEVLTLMIAIAFILLELQNIYHQGAMYTTDSWNYWDWACNVIFIYSFVQRVAALIYMQRLIEYPPQFPPRTTPFPDENEYLSYDYAFDAIFEYINSMSCNIFLSWLKVFKYLQFVPFMRVLVSTLGNSLAQVKIWILASPSSCFLSLSPVCKWLAAGVSTFVLMGATVTMGFVLAHHLALGHDLSRFRSLSFTSLSLYRMLLGDDAYVEMYSSDPFVGPLLYYSWSIVGYFIMLNFFFAILNGALELSKDALPKVSFWETCVMTYKLLDLWVNAQLKMWMSKRGLAVLDQKIAKLPIAKNRSEPQKFLFDAYMLEKDAKAHRFQMLKKKAKDARAEAQQVLVDAKRLEAVENKLARVVGTLTFLQQQRLAERHAAADAAADDEGETTLRRKTNRAESSTTADELGINPKKFHGIPLNSGAPTPQTRVRGPAFKTSLNIQSLPAGPPRR